MVTLAGYPHDYELGDVNHDHDINVSDVTALIAYVLGNDSVGCDICGDLTGDSELNVADVTTLIKKVLNGD